MKIKINLEKAAYSLYCETRRDNLAWPRVFSWGELLPQHRQPYIDDVTDVVLSIKKQNPDVEIDYEY